jgi:hypothetical protein
MLFVWKVVFKVFIQYNMCNMVDSLVESEGNFEPGGRGACGRNDLATWQHGAEHWHFIL